MLEGLWALPSVPAVAGLDPAVAGSGVGMLIAVSGGLFKSVAENQTPGCELPGSVRQVNKSLLPKETTA
jgi:hypothetical protein